MKIHCFQHVPFEGLGIMEDWIAAKGHTLSYTRFYLDGHIPKIENIDWLIIMGGPMGVQEEDKYPWLKKEKHFIEQAINSGKRILGICLGAQIIANILGAKVIPNRYKEIGWFSVKLTNAGKSSVIFQDLPRELIAFHWHGETFEIPHGCIKTMQNDVCSNQAFVYNQKIVGIQFHLEVTKSSIKKLVQNCPNDLIKEPYIQLPDKMLSESEYFIQSHENMNRILNRIENTS